MTQGDGDFWMTSFVNDPLPSLRSTTKSLLFKMLKFDLIGPRKICIGLAVFKSAASTTMSLVDYMQGVTIAANLGKLSVC